MVQWFLSNSCSSCCPMVAFFLVWDHASGVYRGTLCVSVTLAWCITCGGRFTHEGRCCLPQYGSMCQPPIHHCLRLDYTVAQQIVLHSKIPCSIPGQTGSFCVEFACSACVCVGFLWVLHTLQTFTVGQDGSVVCERVIGTSISLAQGSCGFSGSLPTWIMNEWYTRNWKANLSISKSAI